MSKKTLCVGLAVAAVLAMSGCGGGSSTVKRTLTSRVGGLSFNMNASFSVPVGQTREHEGHTITCQQALGAACSVVVNANTGVVSSSNGRITVKVPTVVLTPTPTPTPEPEPGPETLSSALAVETIQPGAVLGIEKAIGAEPKAGSITQSSNTDADGITTDQVEVTAEYGATTPRFSVTNGDEWSIGMDEGNPMAIQGFDQSWKGAQLIKTISGGTLYVDTYTNIEAPTTESVPGGDPKILSRGDSVSDITSLFLLPSPGSLNGESGTFACGSVTCSFSYRNGIVTSISGIVRFTPDSTTRTVQDTDYLAGGVWLFVPDTASSTDDYVFGAFADGGDPFDQRNIMALTGNATYVGGATGKYSQKDGSSTAIGSFYGDVSLTAEFGTAASLGTISGSITDFELDGEATAGSLTLGETAIGSANSGFFKGAVSGSDDSRTYAGKWGGQFFGNGAASTDHPGSVAGTFGAKSTDEAVNYIGFFGALKQ